MKVPSVSLMLSFSISLWTVSTFIYLFIFKGLTIFIHYFIQNREVFPSSKAFLLSHKAAGGIAHFKYLYIRITECFKLTYQLHCFHRALRQSEAKQ